MSLKMWSGLCHVRLREGARRRGVHKTQIEGVLCKVWRRVKELCVGAEVERWGYHMVFSLVIDWMLTCGIIGVSGLVSCCGSSCGRNRDAFAWVQTHAPIVAFQWVPLIGVFMLLLVTCHMAAIVTIVHSEFARYNLNVIKEYTIFAELL